ncbi:MAG: class I SAM-dependent methyltransferase [Desulfobacteraceae bacterium]|nr:class I SAM-dependent methyltransferase [Desulfobacteraceae bacterium]MBC2748849.1 class I SAM-dependent methyltransferase [Desulfobacteraceae bacterium]
MGTDKDWEKWGATDPYFGVLSSEQFRADKINKSVKDQFFDSGKRHVKRVIETIREHFDPKFSPISALDFGCGVGRLVIPLAGLANEVVGVDVSPSMLSEAAKNCELANVRNVTFIQLKDLSNVTGQFDLVHSYIVFQHISWIRGRILIQTLSERVQPGGYIAIHVFTSCNAPKLIRALVRLRYIFPPFNWLRNIAKGRPAFEPAMQLHTYDLSTIKSDLVARNFKIPLCIDEPTGSEFTSTLLFALRMPPNDSFKPMPLHGVT